MREGPDIASLAALIGDPVRASMLVALMDGRALTVSELAVEGGVGLPTASAHLRQLEAGRLVSPRRSGRHKYVVLASDAVAGVIEGLMGLSAGQGGGRSRPGPRDPALRHARVCYNHLAGALGIQLYDSLVAAGYLTLSPDGLTLTGPGRAFATAFGIPDATLAPARAPLCRDCLDWSARRSHLAGRLGRAFLAEIEAKGWARRVTGSRVVLFTPPGERAFIKAFPTPDSRASGR